MSDDDTKLTIFTRASVPRDLGKAWLQHLRDFDTMNPGCHFEVMADAPDNKPMAEMVEMLLVNPGLKFSDVFERKIGVDLYEVAKKVTHDYGMPWTDPRTLVTYPPPKE